MAQQPAGQSLFESYETSYCTAATSVSDSLAELSSLPIGMLHAAPRRVSLRMNPQNQNYYFIYLFTCRATTGQGKAIR